MHTLEQLKRGELTGITRLDLSEGLETFPAEIFELADSLEVLNLSGNSLTSLPEDLPRLHKLRILFCSDNAFTSVPAVIGRCAQLEMVGFKANRIRTLLIEETERALRDIDVLVTPSFGGDVLTRTNLTGHPTVVVPSGFNDRGSPVSISFVGRLWREAPLVTLAKAYQEATGHHRKVPPLFAP